MSLDLKTLTAVGLLLYVIANHYGLPGPTSLQVSVGDYTTRNFDICPSSKKTYETMKAQGVDEALLKRFVMLEDTFLGYERTTVCGGKDLYLQASSLSQEIKSIFQGWDFAYHTIHLKQMAEPLKRINPHLSCMS